jgi:hypothetical protein
MTLSLMKNVFPNLNSVGIRYIYNHNNMDSINIDTNLLDKICNIYERVKIFLYLDISGDEIRKHFHRNPEWTEDISNRIIKALKNRYHDNITIVNMITKLPSLLLSQDNWLFETKYY